MILQELCKFYERKRKEDPQGIPPPGYELREIPYVIVLTKKDEFKLLNRNGMRKRKSQKSFFIFSNLDIQRLGFVRGNS